MAIPVTALLLHYWRRAWSEKKRKNKEQKGQVMMIRKYKVGFDTVVTQQGLQERL